MHVRKAFKQLFAATAIIAALPVAASAQDVVFEGFTLIDGTGAASQPNSAMVVTDGRITWVGAADAMPAQPGIETIDLTGKFVMPGMIDTHVHAGLTKDGLTVDAANQTHENLTEQLELFAAYGVTTVASQGTDQDILLQVRDEQRDTDHPTMARLYSAGLGIVFEGGYGGLAGVTDKVSTPAEARLAVDREAGRNVDWIKFWLDSELDTMPRMPEDMTGAVIEQAHADGLRAVSHIFYLDDAKRVVRQGIDGLTHSVRDQPVDQAFLRAMKEKGTWQMAATLTRERALFAYATPAPWLNDPFFRASVPPETLDQLADPQAQAKIAAGTHFSELDDFLHQAQRNLKAIADDGIPYAMGTDAGGPMRFPGFSEHDELVLMVEAGLTPMQAIVAATSSGARFLRNDEIGSLEPGKWADMIILNQDPLADIHNSRTISAVYMAGRQIPSITGQGAQ